jgi:Calcineurin-like phosphoesterase
MARARATGDRSGAEGRRLRYAHPFFTATPPDQRPADFSPYGQRMASWIAQSFGPIPPPDRDPVLQLADVIGADGVSEIETEGAIRFHAVGDTGRPDVHSNQEAVAQQMATDYSPAADGKNPAFFFHLGDVIYGPDKDQMYRDEFYRPYIDYPGKILAIAGNHDGEVFPNTDPDPLKAFKANFCAPTAVVPPIANDVRIFRETMTQPGVYYLIRAPFVDIVALYSNIAEGPGSIIGENGDTAQKDWLTKTLGTIADERKAGTRNALVLACHHPPYSNGGHGGSPQMLSDFDDACSQAGVQPDAVLSGHAHNYQRHTRTAGGQSIPFIVAGCGGHNDSSVDAASGQVDGDHSFDKSFKGFGYLLVTASPKTLQIDFHSLGETGDPFDSVTVDLS